MLCRKITVNSKRGSVAVHLNVYDLTSMNGYAYWLGLGVYHSGVQVHGVEYAFGAHEYPTSGIFEGEPKHCEGFTFRKSILIGWTNMTPEEVRGVMEELAGKYRGDAYNLITKNCNHFCNDVCFRLTGKSIPRWVNRLARLGLFCNCVLPAGLHETKVQHVRAADRNCDKKKIRSQSSRYVSASNPQHLTSTSRGVRTRSCRHQNRHSSSSLYSSPVLKTQL